MDENIFSLSCYYDLSSMSLDVSLKVTALFWFCFLHLLLREKKVCFGLLDFLFGLIFVVLVFTCSLGFFFYLCCKLQFCSLFFFTSVLRRTVTLLTQLAKEMASHAALETQVNDATEAAKKYMAENERLQEVSLSFFSNFVYSK